MHLLNKYLFNSIIIVLFFNSCGEDNPTQPPPPTILLVKTFSASDSTAIINSNVLLYNADNGEAVSRAFSDQEGIASFENIGEGNYYVKLSAQNFSEIPQQQNLTPIPFSVSSGQTQTINYFLDPYPGSWGKIDGYVKPAVSGVLISAENQDDNTGFKTYSGHDGYFVMYNLGFGSYEINALKAAYSSDSLFSTTLSQNSSEKTIEINISQKNGTTLRGSVTFLAVTNGIIDISILNKHNLATINGLTTVIDAGRNYEIKNIPKGEFFAWASYKNDGYVMDPDWIFKNPGALEITFLSDTNASLNFSVTGAIKLNSPTNHPDTVLPVLVDSGNTTFTWYSYPQAKEYIIEVKDLNGNIIWGGIDNDGTIKHGKIPKEVTSVEFNFDGTASSLLTPGKVYQWKIYADDDAVNNVQTLLSSSEDLMGLFKIK